MRKLIFTLLIILCSLQITQGQWTKMYCPLTGPVSGFINSGTRIFVVGVGGVCISTNNGVNWTVFNNGLTNLNVWSFAISGTNIFAGTYGGGVFRSSNNGESWTSVNDGLSDYYIRGLTVWGTTLFAGTGSSGVFLSTNDGTNWIAANGGISNQYITSIKVLGANLFAGTYGGGVFFSSNNGISWSAINNGLTNNNIIALEVVGANLFAGTYGGGVFFSSNNGTNWINTGLIGDTVETFAVSGTNLFAGTFGSGVFLSNNNGASWIAKNEGMSILYIYCLLTTSNYIFAGSVAGNYFRRPISEMIDIQNISTEVPSRFTLSQNYPNPFNPFTNIRYDLRKPGFVKLVVFDALGRELETFVNEQQSPGTYSVDWNASEYPSGVYFYRLQTDSYTEVKKMILAK